MKALVIGARDDVAGFALAGIEGRVCTTPDETEHAIDTAGDALLIFSARAAENVARLGEWARSGSGPLFVVLAPR